MNTGRMTMTVSQPVMAVVVSDLLPGLFDGVIAGREDASDIVITVFHVFVNLVEILPQFLLVRIKADVCPGSGISHEVQIGAAEDDSHGRERGRQGQSSSERRDFQFHNRPPL